MPLIKAHDTALQEQLADWDRSLSPDREKSAGESKKRPAGTDLLIAPNPNNSYPVYKLMQKAVTFHTATLLDILKVLSRTDGYLKSSGQPPRSILADAVLRICGAFSGQAPQTQ